MTSHNNFGNGLEPPPIRLPQPKEPAGISLAVRIDGQDVEQV